MRIRYVCLGYGILLQERPLLRCSVCLQHPTSRRVRVLVRQNLVAHSNQCHRLKYRRDRFVRVRNDVAWKFRRSLSSRCVVCQPSLLTRRPRPPPLSRQLQRPCRQRQQQSLRESCVLSHCTSCQYMITNSHGVRYIRQRSRAERVRVGVGSNLRKIEVCDYQEEEGACDKDVVVVL